jgi:two-component system phosphate regulon response regulator OmpR
MTAGKVLIVDDDRDVRDMLAEYLATHGYEVAQADGGATMRTELERSVPDVVLLDVGLPGEDGLSLARYLRERYDLGIIMVTGAGEVVDRIVGLEMGADDYVAKPFDPRELRARLKSVMRRVQSRAAPAAPQGPPGSAEDRIPVGRHLLDLKSHQLFAPDGQGRADRWSSVSPALPAPEPGALADRLLAPEPGVNIRHSIDIASRAAPDRGRPEQR